MIKAIILDCLGVLYVPLGEDFYSSNIPNYSAHRNQILDLTHQLNFGMIEQEELIRKISELTRVKPEELKRTTVDGLIRNKALLDYAQELRKKYKLGMISNISSATMNLFFTHAERRELFDSFIVSEEVPFYKPQPQIYELACKQLDVETSEAVMIDDSPINCSGALEAGLKAIVYQNFEQTQTELEKLTGSLEV